MLPARFTRSCLRTCKGIHARPFSTTPSVLADNPIPANDPKNRDTPSPVSSTNAMPLSSEGNMDKPLQESVAEGEERRVMQAPNRETVWSRSQQPREKAMVGPRFEQMIMYDQAKESNRKMLESLPSTSYPLKPTGHEAEVPQGYQSNTGKPLEQR
ncbi:hypothetical protein D6D13_09451 [Aureobasidium pullulans]|uniref:Uncharacterized protein n=1 Tax=Aureobasidium pullulans TaxID=5580 RepID=A0A4S9C243_AURPU|nr:hypothetical protein D6D13_09451 [Aureobasidium pullulans]